MIQFDFDKWNFGFSSFCPTIEYNSSLLPLVRFVFISDKGLVFLHKLEFCCSLDKEVRFAYALGALERLLLQNIVALPSNWKRISNLIWSGLQERSSGLLTQHCWKLLYVCNEILNAFAKSVLRVCGPHTTSPLDVSVKRLKFCGKKFGKCWNSFVIAQIFRLDTVSSGLWKLVPLRLRLPSLVRIWCSMLP